MSKRICTVKILFWKPDEQTVFEVRCNVCERVLGGFSQHESAMAWAQAHAAGSKHIRREVT